MNVSHDQIDPMRTTLILNQAAASNGLPPGINAPPNFSSLWQAFQRRWLVAVCLGVLFGCAVFALLLTVFPAKYVAEARIGVSQKNKGLNTFTQGEQQDFNLFKKTVEANVKTPSNLQKTLDQYVSKEEAAKGVDGRRLRDLEFIRTNSGDDLKWLEKALKTHWNVGPETLTIQLSGDNPEEVALILNTLVATFEKDYQSTDYKLQTEQYEALEKKVKDQARKLAEANDDLVKSGGLLRPKDTDLINYQRSQMGGWQVSLVEKENEFISKTKTLETYLSWIANPSHIVLSAAAVDKDLVSEPLIMRDLENLKRVDGIIESIYKVAPAIIADQESAKYKDERERTLRRIEEQKKALRPLIESRLRDVEKAKLANEIPRLKLEVDTALSQKNNLAAKLEDAKKTLDQMPNSSLSSSQAAKQKEVEALQDSLKTSKQQLADIDFKRQKDLRVSIVENAQAPKQKDTARQMKVAGGGAGLACLLVVSLISFSEFRTRKISRPEDVSYGLGIRLMGTIPPLPAKIRKNLADGQAQSHWQVQLNESVDTVRTMLLHAARAEQTKVVLVTSAASGEGKTSLASQLAASLARAWKKTLLIDGDLRNPANHKLFGLPLEPGLCELLRGEINVGEAVRCTQISRLWMISAGHWDQHAIQALAQENVRTMLDQLKQQYDFIIIDSSPVLAVADALLLGQHADASILAVMRDVSQSPAVFAAKCRLDNLGIKSLGAVMIGAPNTLAHLSAKYIGS